MSNYYSTYQLGYDTTKYALVKNAETSQNTRKFPAFGITIAYNYKLTSHLFLDFKLMVQFFYPVYVFDSYNTRTNGKIKRESDTRDAYIIKSNIIIAPLVGFKYQLF